MTTQVDCTENNDPLKLVREGTSQEQRLASALNPDYVPINQRKPEHWMVFALAYARYLKYYDSEKNTVAGDWSVFFSKDVSVLLAMAAIQDVNQYKIKVKETFDFLNNSQNTDEDLKTRLGYLFSYVGTLADRLDALKEGLPAQDSLSEIVMFKSALQNLIQSQLAPLFERMIGYYKRDVLNKADDLNLIADSAPDEVILGSAALKFSAQYEKQFSRDWITNDAADWNAYLARIKPIDSFGSGTVFERINHIATHNLFTAIFDKFLKVYARIVTDAQQALYATFKWDGHEPHYALFLAFLKLFEQTNTETNTLTQRHLDFYYKEVLKLKAKPAVPGHAFLLMELAKQVDMHELKTGELFQAGKDGNKIEAFFANDRDFVANQAKVVELRTVYRHGEEALVSKNGISGPVVNHKGRVFASPVANSNDGMGAELTTVDHSWHPFFNKIYLNGELAEIKMPPAEIGFAIASHYLWMAEGARKITATFTIKEGKNSVITNDIIACFLTSEKGWTKKDVSEFSIIEDKLIIAVELDGNDPPVIPYDTKKHQYNFNTVLPILLVKLNQNLANGYGYNDVQDIVISEITLDVEVGDVKDGLKPGLKTLAVSNDFGPVDTSKPFQPFGASPQIYSALIIGSKEVFQKTLDSVAINLRWQAAPQPFPIADIKGSDGKVIISAKKVNIHVEYLQKGKWEQAEITKDINDILPPKDINDIPPPIPLNENGKMNNSVMDAPDFSQPVAYNTAASHGYVRLVTDADFGQSNYEQALINYIKLLTDNDAKNDVPKPIPPVGPFITELSLSYRATQPISLSNAEKSAFDDRQGYFFHIAPFGYSEQHPYLKNKFPETETNLPDKDIYLLPPLKHLNPTEDKHLNLSRGKPIAHEAEFFIGVSGLKPPQNLALLFQVVDGTANPRTNKPEQHIRWGYLRENEWVSFAKNEVADLTSELLNSNIVTLSVPRDASDSNSLLPAGMHWLRAAVESKSDAVCRLQLVAAQALAATFTNKGNDPAFAAKVLPEGTISKLEQPDADVKQISQPFPSFGGQGEEPASVFYTRVSERLRHKDRAIALWDYERLILEAFPQIYKVKCLNHTHYETDDQDITTYKELAAGHVTIVTIPKQSFHKLRDPLKPYTSLGLLTEIETFLKKRMSCFVTPHVKNPQFEEVFVDCKVCFREGADQTYFTNKLQEAISRFLSPWAFSDNAHPSFGGKIYKSVLINFVEEQTYVDYVTDFQLFHSFIIFEQDKSRLETIEKNEVEGSTAVSILVSGPTHKIRFINPAEQATPLETCRCES
jgi:hypothetical protein